MCKLSFKGLVNKRACWPISINVAVNTASVVNYIFSFDFVQFYFVAVVIGGGVSIPCFLFLRLCTQILIRSRRKTAAIRMYLLIISMLCCITIFALFSLPDLSSIWKGNNIKLMGAYALPLVFSVLVYRLEK